MPKWNLCSPGWHRRLRIQVGPPDWYPVYAQKSHGRYKATSMRTIVSN